jgi:putative hemolysin
VVAAITIASLIIGELVPKRLALLNPEAIASVVAKPMQALSMIAHPIVRTLSVATETVLRLFGLRGSIAPPVTEEEIKVLMQQGAEAGVFEEHEQALVKRVFRMDELKVTGVMTPRSEITYLDVAESLGANLRRIAESSHSRFPVARGGLDRVEGIVHARTLLEDAVSGKPVELAARLVKALFVPETLTVMQLIELFKKHRQTIGLVINEYGELQGLVTLNDVLEALVGDIATVEGEEERDVVQRDDGSWLIDGSATIERFKDAVDVHEPLPEEDSGTYHTLGGFVMMRLGRVPHPGDKFQWNGFGFEVVDMDRNRVDKVIVAHAPEDSAEAK